MRHFDSMERLLVLTSLQPFSEFLVNIPTVTDRHHLDHSRLAIDSIDDPETSYPILPKSFELTQ